tara:strand:- start:14127 stop:14372 length:246 start_codon:yes stop_codon:yes gene_type:complete
MSQEETGLPEDQGMTAEEQVDAVTHLMHNTVARVIQEWDMITVETMVGILAYVQRDLLETTVEFDFEEPEDEEPEDEGWLQ